MDNLILDFGLVMALLLIAPLISKGLRLPDIVGLILAGVVVGEHGLGLFQMDATFELLGAVGLLYLMFLAGLEININEFHRYRKPSLVFGTLTFLLPQTLGAVGAWWLLDFPWPKAILLASMFASHTLIPFPIVHRLGLGRNRAVTTTIGGTILTDTAALLVLAIIVKGGGHGVMASADGLGIGFWLRLGSALALLVAGALYLLPKLSYWVFQRQSPDSSAIFTFVLAVVFLTSYASELAGVEPIIGAFLAGLALSSLIPERGVLMNRMHFVGHALFIPFFLFSVGMRVNLRALMAGKDGWIIALYMLTVAILVKWLAAHASGRLLGYDRDERGIVFGLSVNQAAATLAAVLVGTRVGIFDDAVLNGTILMILGTCLVGPWVTEKYGRRLAEREKHSPAGPRRESGRIMVPLASPARSEAIMDLALMVRPERCEESVYPLHVVQDGEGVNQRIALAERLLGGAVARAVAANVPVIPLTRISVNVAEGILHAATEFDVSAVVIGWTVRRHNLPFAHNIPVSVITHGLSAMLVHRPGEPLSTVKRFWVAMPPLIERHDGFANAVRIIQRIASQAGAHLHVLATESTLESLRHTLRTKHDSSVHLEAIAAWAQVTEIIEQRFATHDGLVLLSSRRTQLAWQPSLERLPIDWTNRWPDANFIMLYPPIPDETAARDTHFETATNQALSSDLPNMEVIHVTSSEAEVAIRQALKGVLAVNAADIELAVGQLLRTGPVPLSGDMALLHTHTVLLETARVVVAIGSGGLALDGCPSRPKALILLLSPAGGTPEQHLHVLAAIARAAREGKIPTE